MRIVIIIYIGDKEIGRYSNPIVRLQNHLFHRKMVFKMGRYFDLLNKLYEHDELKKSIIITSSSNRSYTIDQFIENLQFADEIV